MKNNYIHNLGKAIKMEIREHKSSFIVYAVLRLLVIAVLVLQLLNRNYENVFLCILTLLLMIVPSMIQVTFRVELPTTLEIIILFFFSQRKYWARSMNFICSFRSGIPFFIL